MRQGEGNGSSFSPAVLVPDEQSFLLLATSFLLYPFFIASVLFPAFPLVARVLVGICTLLMFAYLLSVPGVAVVVFGLWSALLPTAFFLFPGASILSFPGVIGLSVTWVPFALSLLTLSVLRK